MSDLPSTVQNLQGSVDALTTLGAQITRDSAANTLQYNHILTTLADFRSSIEQLARADKNHTSELGKLRSELKGEIIDVKNTLATLTASHATIGTTLEAHTTSHERTLAAVQNVSNEQHATKDA